MLSYIRRGDPVLAAQMNDLTAASSSALGGIMGNKSFALAFPGNIPARLLGKCFFFTAGATAYAQKFPGAVTFTTTAVDQITGATVSAQGVRAYDEAAISAAIAAKAVTAFQDPKQIAVIGDVTIYPTGLTRIAGIGLYEHSLFTYIRLNAGKRYWVRETAAVFPSKRYRKAVAEIIIEGVDTVTIPVGADVYRYFRVHNLQNRQARFIIERFGSTPVIFTLAPFECRCYTREFDGYDSPAETRARWKSVVESPYLYFFQFKTGEEPLFWYWNSLPTNPSIPAATLSADGTVVTATGSMPANNTVNPSVLYDFLYAFRENGTAYARFRRDPHELCNMAADYTDLFACLKSTPEFPANEKGQLRSDAIVGDMFHHKGTMEINKLNAAATARVSASTFEFRGYKTLVADLAAAGFSTSSAGGNLVISKSDSGTFVYDLFPIGTNFLKRTGFATDGLQDGDQFLGYVAWQRIPVGVSVPRTIEDRIFEADISFFGAQQVGQDVRGDAAGAQAFAPSFTLRNLPSYRIYKRAMQAAARTFSYTGFDSVNVVAPGAPVETIIYSGGAGNAIVGVHVELVSSLLTLRNFGDASGAQDDANVTYTLPVATLTPEGWVITFTESVRSDRLPFAQASLPAFDALLYLVAPYAYPSNPLNAYRFNQATGRLELKHCIRFRKHGFGFTQLGKEFALHYSATRARLTNPDFIDAISGTDGGDYILPQTFVTNGVKLMRSVLVSECVARGVRFYGDARTVDGWAAYDSQVRAVYPSLNGRRLIGGYSNNGTVESVLHPRQTISSPDIVVPTFVPMLAEHYNAMAQAVNQLKNNVPFSRMPLIVYGQKILDFTPSTSGAWLRWQEVFRTANNPIPAPVAAFAGLNTGHADAPYYEKALQDNGVIFKGTEPDYPDLATRKIQFSITERYNTQGIARITISNSQTTAGVMYHTGTFTVDNWTPGGITPGTIQTNGQVGVAAIETMPFIGVDLTTAYTARRWVSTTDFKTFAMTIGFPMLLREFFIPLKLDVLTRTSDCEDSTIKPQSSPVFSGIVGQTNPITVDALYTQSGMHADGTIEISVNSVGLTKQQLLFRLAESTETPEWKIGIPSSADLAVTGYRTLASANTANIGDFTGFYRRDRAVGRVRLSTGLHVNFACTNQIRPDTKYGFVFNLALFNAAGEVDERHEGFDTNQVFHQMTSGPRWFRDIKIPTDAAEKLSQDRLAAFLYLERRWFAVNVVTTFANYSSVFGSVGLPDWGFIKDWWLRDAPSYMTSLFHPLGFQSFANTNFAPPRDIVPTTGQFFSVGPGVTVLQPPEDSSVRFVEAP
jgi:hypothetical protein